MRSYKQLNNVKLLLKFNGKNFDRFMCKQKL